MITHCSLTNMNFITKTVVTLCCLLVITRINAQDYFEESFDYGDELTEDVGYEPQIVSPFEPFPFGFGPAITQNIPQVTTTARSLQNFSFDVFNSIHQDESSSSRRNMIISPLSIFTAMAILRPGLGGESLRQIENLLGNERINNAEIGNTLDAIFTEENEYELDHANRMYVDRAVLLRKPYKRELSKLRVALAKRVNFAEQPEENRMKINRYVRKKTRRLISEMVPEGGISARTKLYMINALYLKAKWGFQFNPKSTVMKEFHLDNQNSIMVPTMHTDFAPCSFRHDSEHQAEVTVLPLHDNLSMLIVMPNSIGNFTKLFDDEETPMKNKFHTIINDVWSGENNGERILEACSLDLPKFSLQFEADLKNSLRRLGLRDVFNRNDANLSPMTQNHVEGLYVSDALHKAVLTANEDGLEAGAATSIGISIRRAADVRVQINKPFLFAIRQDLTGAILFVGKVVRP